MDNHRIFVGDRETQRRFRRAIRETVRPGDVVLDLGTGTGIHCVLACRAGASRVYAVEAEDVIHVAREVVRANGCADRVTCIQGRFPRIDLPESVDVIITNQGFGDALRLLTSGSARFLKPGGRTIPSAIRLFVVPLTCPRAYRESVAFWTQPHHGVDLSPGRRQAVESLRDFNFGREGFLARPAGFQPIVPTAPVRAAYRWSAQFVVTRPGTLHGLGGWFEYRLSPRVKLSTGPPMIVASPPWKNLFFAFNSATRMKGGDRIDVEILVSVQPAQNVWVWRAAASRRSGLGWATFFREAHSNVNTWPLSGGVLDKLAPQARPSLSHWGEARLSALSLCDGRRSVAEIEHELHRRFPALFVSPADAGGFVAEIIARDAR